MRFIFISFLFNFPSKIGVEFEEWSILGAVILPVTYLKVLKLPCVLFMGFNGEWPGPTVSHGRGTSGAMLWQDPDILIFSAYQFQLLWISSIVPKRKREKGQDSTLTWGSLCLASLAIK